MPWEFLKAVWESGASSVWVEGKQAKARWPQKAPEAIREVFIDGKALLGEWLIKEAQAGRCYVWSTILNDLVVIVTNQEAVKGVPKNIVPYKAEELMALRGTLGPEAGEEKLKQVHMAKKIFGGTIKEVFSAA